MKNIDHEKYFNIPYGCNYWNGWICELDKNNPGVAYVEWDSYDEKGAWLIVKFSNRRKERDGLRENSRVKVIRDSSYPFGRYIAIR